MLNVVTTTKSGSMSWGIIRSVEIEKLCRRV